MDERSGSRYGQDVTFAAIVRACDGMVALADGWTHHPCRPQADLFDTRKLVKLVVGTQPAVVVLAGRATINSIPVANIIAGWAAGADCTTVGLRQLTQLLAAEIAERGDAADTTYEATELLTSWPEGGNEPWYHVAVDGIGDWTKWLSPGGGPIACIGGAAGLAEGIFEEWDPTAHSSKAVAEYVVTSLQTRYADDPQAFFTAQSKAGGTWQVLRTNLDVEPLRIAIGPQSVAEVAQLEQTDTC